MAALPTTMTYLWECPGCHRTFKVPEGKMPTLCPECRNQFDGMTSEPRSNHKGGNTTQERRDAVSAIQRTDRQPTRKTHPTKPTSRFWALKFIAAVYEIVALLIILLPTALVIGFILMGINSPISSLVSGVVGLLFVIPASIIVALPFAAVGQVIRLMLAIEENTRSKR